MKSIPSEDHFSASTFSVNEWWSIFEAIKEPVIVMDAFHRVVAANNAAIAMFSPLDQPVIGEKCYKLFTGSARPCRHCDARQNTLSNSCTLTTEHTLLGKQFRSHCVPFYEQKKLKGYVHTFQDITKQRGMEKALVNGRKIEAIATLAGGIAHDFNNILGAVLGNADLLLFRLPENIQELYENKWQSLSITDVKKHLEAIRKAGLRAKDLVSQILAFSREKNNAQQPLMLDGLVEQTIKQIQAMLPATITLQTDFKPISKRILVVPSEIRQCLMNLCTNAVAALEGKCGVIEITVFEAGNSRQDLGNNPEGAAGSCIVLQVSDTGVGMLPDIQERIFDPFFTTQEVGRGRGLGLAVLHGIVVSHGGHVDVRSAPGQGSTFTLYFPAATDEEINEAADPLTSLPTGKERIFLIDDKEDVVKMRARMLEYLGYTVLSVPSGQQVLTCLENHLHDIDLVIADHNTGGMTKMAFAEKIHYLRRDLPIILCVGAEDDLTDKDPGKVGVEKILTQPYDMKEIVMAIHQIFPGTSS